MFLNIKNEGIQEYIQCERKRLKSLQQLLLHMDTFPFV